jgi:ABC-2 type transport system ATP-binding protein
VTASVGEPAVVLDGVVKRYGSRTVLDGVSLAIGRGEVVALLGPNGAGKTTAVEIVEGYRPRDGGTVTVLGQDPATGGRGLRARVGLMLQDGGVDRRARPRETLVQYGRFHADPRDPDELLRLVGLDGLAQTAYRRLSGGERQRLGLALALVGRPEVVMLDEPTAGMDPEARAATRQIVGQLRDDGAAILLTSHDLADVERSADRIAVLAGGRIVASGSPAELMAAASPSLRIRLDPPLEPADLEALGRAIGGTVVAIEPGRYRIDGAAPSPTTVATLTAWCAVVDRRVVELTTVGGTLEDAYLELVGRA